MWLFFVALNAWAADIEFGVGEGNAVLVKATGEAVYVPACRGVSWSRFNGETGAYEPTNADGCGPLSSAIRVGSEGLEFKVDVPLPPVPAVGFHVLRPTVVYGLKCMEETPFPLASCERVETVDGPQVLVRGRGTAEVLKPAKTE